MSLKTEENWCLKIKRNEENKVNNLFESRQERKWKMRFFFWFFHTYYVTLFSKIKKFIMMIGIQPHNLHILKKSELTMFLQFIWWCLKLNNHSTFNFFISFDYFYIIYGALKDIFLCIFINFFCTNKIRYYINLYKRQKKKYKNWKLKKF